MDVEKDLLDFIKEVRCQLDDIEKDTKKEIESYLFNVDALLYYLEATLSRMYRKIKKREID